MTKGEKISTTSRIAALKQLVNAGRRLSDLLLYDTKGEPGPQVIRGVRVEEQFGHTMVKYGEWKQAMTALWEAWQAARSLCGEMTSVDDVGLLYVELRKHNEDTWLLEDRYPNHKCAGAAVGIRVPHCVSDVQRALDHIKGEMKRLKAERHATLPPLTEKERAVLDIIKAVPEGRGIIGKKICSQMAERGQELGQGTLRRHIIPKLKPHGVKNRSGEGYYHDPS